MLYIYIVTGRELIKLLRKHGWQLDRVSGSHHIMKKQKKTLTIPVHSRRDIPKGTLNSILKEAGLK
jgi:predicted RNA binding protein YcfA (HicA-like mRNA interferase family)